jgi:hypothetical protein
VAAVEAVSSCISDLLQIEILQVASRGEGSQNPAANEEAHSRWGVICAGTTVGKLAGASAS